LHERHLPSGDYHQLFRDKCFVVEEHADAVHAGHRIWGGGEPRFGVAAEVMVVEMKIQLRGEVLAR
jgi:hypothetical protein